MSANNVKPIIALCFACIIWGLSGIYYDELSHIPPLEVLAHRSLWAMIFFSGIIIYQGQILTLVKNVIKPQELLLLSCSAFMISANWFSFIFAIQSSQAVQASFGYYVFPLVAVVLGYLFKGERFSTIQMFSIVFTGFAVVALGFALRLLPSIALIIAFTFGAYGLIKSFTKLRSIESVTIETILIAPFSLGFIILGGIYKYKAGYEVINSDLLLLMLSGVITGGPLILFSYATKKISYATVGILQYINPTLQFLVAIFILSEPFNPWHVLALIFIWIGILSYTGESLRLGSRR